MSKLDQIKEKFRQLTFKRMKGSLTESEEKWLNDATKAFHARWARYANRTLTKHRIDRLHASQRS